MKFRLLFLLCSILLALPLGCGVPADYSGRASGTGIGGTGALAEKGTGIGGTGNLAGRDGDRLGILGRITGFGSIWVNGLEVEFDQSTPVETAGPGIAAAKLAEGQVVEVVAENDSGVVRAESIRVRYEVIGPVQSVSPDRQKIIVLDQQVLLAADAVLPHSWPDTVSGKPVVRVTGFRNNWGTILASRVEYGDTGDSAHLIGRVEGAAGELTVSGLPVRIPGNSRPLRSGDIVRVSGNLRDGILAARSVRSDSPTVFAAKVDRFLIQAVAVSRDAAGSVRLGGMPFQVRGDATASGRPPGRPSLFMGVMGADGGFRLQGVMPSPAMNRPSVSSPSMSRPPEGERPFRGPSMPTGRPGGAMGDRGGMMGR